MNASNFLNHKRLRAVLIAIAVIAIYLLTREWLGLNDSEKVLGWITDMFQRFGLPFVFVAGLLEGVLLINWYWPGSGVILLGAALASRAGLPLEWLIVTAVSSLWLGYLFDYALGRYGWYKLVIKYGGRPLLERAQKQLKQRGHIGVWFWYAHPQTANFVATAAGILQYKFWPFAITALMAQALWGTAWALLVNAIGLTLLDQLIQYSLPALVLFLIIWLYRVFKKPVQNHAA